jgi:hypothetical protein
MPNDHENANDPILQRLIEASNESDRQNETDSLVSSRALPTIERVLTARLRRSKLAFGDIKEDLVADVIVKLLRRLDRLGQEPETSPIRSFDDYVAVVTYHAFDDFMRRTFPARSSVFHKVRYLLTHDSKFAMWDVDQRQYCGRAEWRGREDGLRSPESLEALRTSGQSDDLRAVLIEIFDLARRPIELSPLVTIVMSSWDGAEVPPLVQEDRSDPLARLENIQVLRFLWSEIRQLPVRQRIALLLNLRDSAGDSVARLLPMTGVASIDEIADALEMTDFPEVWASLPLDDLRIASLLQLSRQQVINLRKSARERLARRMARSYE